jgi:murein DD-endopeptidase MepM/ murein hydrolase activator NlpD
MYGMKSDPSQDLDLLGLETPFADTFDAVDTFGGQAAYGETPFAESEGDFEETGEESLDWLDLEEESGEAGDDEDEAGDDEAGDDEDVWTENLSQAAYDEAGDDFAFENEPPRASAAKSYLGGSLWTYRSRSAGTEVAIYLPPAARGQSSIDLLFYVHGLISAEKKGVWKAVCGARESLAASFITGSPFNLGKIIAESGRPVALVLPRFQNFKQLWTAHRLDRPARLNAFLAEALAEIGRASGDPQPTLSSLAIAGHSRAYGILYELAGAHSSPEFGRGPLARLTHLWSLDASYNYSRNPFKREDFEALISARSGLTVSFVYIKNSPTDRFADWSPTARIDLRPVAQSPNGHCLLPAKCLPALLAGPTGAGQSSREHSDFSETEEFLPRIWPMPAPAPRTFPALEPCQQRIADLIDKSTLRSMRWPQLDRKTGKYEYSLAPPAYLLGMALTYARVYCKWRDLDPYVLLMAAAEKDFSATRPKEPKATEGIVLEDMLYSLRDHFKKSGMANTSDGPDTLRHLFVLLVGLGLRESWGRYYQGPYKATPPEKLATAAAGMFQMSHSLGVGNKGYRAVHGFYEYLRTVPYNGYLTVFAHGMRPGNNKVTDKTPSEPGRFRNFCLTQPALGAELAALAIRYRNHWSPLRDKTEPVYLSKECDDLFQRIQQRVDAEKLCTCFLPPDWRRPPPPPDEPAAETKRETGFGSGLESGSWSESREEADDEQWLDEGEQFDEAEDERFDEEEGEFGEEEAADDVTGEFGYFEEEWQPTGSEPLAVPSTAPIAFAALPPEGSFWPVRTKVAQRKLVSFPYKDKNRLLFVGRPGRTFLANRKTKKKEPRWHIGVDLFARRGDIVVACEAGTIVAFSHFYTASTGQDTFRLLIHHPASQVVVNYGEVTKDSLRRNQLKVGSEVQAGQEIGFVSDTDMIHFEAWAPADSPKAYATIPRWMKKDKKPPARLLNPTRYLLFLRENGVDP